MAEIANDLIGHLEGTLGRIRTGWRATDERCCGTQVARFDGAPTSGFVTFSTVGLSNHSLRLSDGRGVRLELLVSCWERNAEFSVPPLLHLIASDIAGDSSALECGDVIGPAGPLFGGGELSAFYCCIPVFFPRDFRVWEGSDPQTVFAQLIPISDDEAHYVSHLGWRAFEEHLEARDPDVFDLERKSSLRHLPSGEFVLVDGGDA